MKQEARNYAAQRHFNCALEAVLTPTIFGDQVTHKQRAAYVMRHLRQGYAVMCGLHDDNFTIWQRMNSFETGECVAFLPKCNG